MHGLRGNPSHLMGVLIIGIFLSCLSPSSAQFQQEVNVRIEGYTFHTTQMPLQLHTETLITITNLDEVRHDFRSDMFKNIPTRIETDGAVAYGNGLEGVYVNPGKEAAIRMTLDHSGRFKFQCSIHQDMKGEILLLTVDAA